MMYKHSCDIKTANNGVNANFRLPIALLRRKRFSQQPAE
jgi:hypothetical protein